MTGPMPQAAAKSGKSSEQSEQEPPTLTNAALDELAQVPA